MWHIVCMRVDYWNGIQMKKYFIDSFSYRLYLVFSITSTHRDWYETLG